MTLRIYNHMFAAGRVLWFVISFFFVLRLESSLKSSYRYWISQTAGIARVNGEGIGRTKNLKKRKKEGKGMPAMRTRVFTWRPPIFMQSEPRNYRAVVRITRAEKGPNIHAPWLNLLREFIRSTLCPWVSHYRRLKSKHWFQTKSGLRNVRLGCARDEWEMGGCVRICRELGSGYCTGLKVMHGGI